MHLDHGGFPEAYKKYSQKKVILIILSIFILLIAGFLSISMGAVSIPVTEVLKVLSGQDCLKKHEIIIWNIRFPEMLTAIVSGIGLSVCGVVMQSILKNPLGSPFTLGISNAAAFGAAFSVMILGTGVMQSSAGDAINISNPYTTTIFAFIFSLVASTIIMVISKFRRAVPEIIILAGVALGSLFTAGTMFLQYFADDMQLAAMVFWTFGDLSRASWNELQIIFIITTFSVIYFIHNRWNYNAMIAGDETAMSLGVKVEKVRITGMIVSSLLTAGIISFLGVIGFVGLICPHIAKRIIGDDHRYLIPFSAIIGGILMVCAGIAGRCILAPHTLPVAVLTSFLGAPVFIYLLISRRNR